MFQRPTIKDRVILGIDPGTRITGYGVIKVCHPQIQLIDFGCIRPPVQETLPARYLALFKGVEEVLRAHSPETVVVETQFVDKNVQSALKLAMARAAVLIAAAGHGVPIFEYTPRKAKLAVVGKGNASKGQVQKMIQLLLNLPCLPEPEDAADALALAICHAHSLSSIKR